MNFKRLDIEFIKTIRQSGKLDKAIHKAATKALKEGDEESMDVLADITHARFALILDDLHAAYSHLGLVAKTKEEQDEYYDLQDILAESYNHFFTARYER